jgi:3-oxoacyl-[acyl-carrier protein] reductase
VSRPENATALVTGASKGIGAAIAKTLAADGWLVAVNYRSDEDGAKATVKAIEDAGGVAADGLAIQLEDDQWDRVIGTNLTAAFRLTRRAMRPMIKARYGRIINIASVVGPRANAGQSNYAAAKAGLIGMTKTVAAEVARRGVTVNAVAPGFIETDMTKDIPEAVIDMIPARRVGAPDDVAAAVRFLASDDAGYVTGTTLFVDGGMSA